MQPIRLEETELAPKMLVLAKQQWERVSEEWLEKTYRFHSFSEAIDFVVNVAQEAEKRAHHPTITIDYRTVTIRLTTWTAGGLTSLDFESAEAYDHLAEQQTL